MASPPTSCSSTMTPDSSEASAELQNTKSPVGANDQDDKGQGSFEVSLFNFEEMMRYIRKLKEENTLLKEELATIKKENKDRQEMEKNREESFQQEVKMLRHEKMELEMKLQKAVQYATVRDMEAVLEKCGEMEQKFGETKEALKKDLEAELKEELKEDLKE